MILGTPAVARAALLGSLLLSVNSHTWPTHSSKLKLKRLIDVRAVGLWHMYGSARGAKFFNIKWTLTLTLTLILIQAVYTV